jgi:hypothetical protein
MSEAQGSNGSDSPQSLASATREFHKRGRVLGLDYDLGIRLTALADTPSDEPRPPLLSRAGRHGLPRAAEWREAPDPDGAGGGESESGSTR